MDIKNDLIMLSSAKKYTYRKRFSLESITSNSEYIILFVKSGRITVEAADNTYTVSASELLFLPCGIIKGTNSSLDINMNVLYFSGSAAEMIYRKIRNNPHIAVAAHSDIHRKFEQLMYLYESILPKDKLLSLNLLWEILGDIAFGSERYEVESNIPSHVLTVWHMFHEHPENAYLLDDLAKATHINKFKLIKDFKEYFHEPPMQYLLELRIKLAKELLTATDMNVTQIAQKIGFSNPNYFIHIFKNKTGVSPTEYRNKSKN